MRILQVTAALEQGGVERGTVEMATYTIHKGETSIVASQGGRMVQELSAVGAHHVLLPLARRDPFSILYCAWRLRKLILEEKISLVHARSRAPAWASYLACRLTGTPFITTFHGTHKIQNCFKKIYNSSMVRGRRVIAISQFIRRHIADNYQVPDELIDIAPRGFDPIRFNPTEISLEEQLKLRADLGCSEDDVLVTLPGRLTRWKGQLLFIEALAEIKDLSWIALLVGGAGSKDAYLEELKEKAHKLGISERIVFCGNQHDIAPYYAISDLVVSASTEPEAFGRVAVEAQAMAKPVVASAHGGALETVKDGVTGWLFQNNNSEALARCLRDALSDKEELARKGLSARNWVLENYTIDRMCSAEWSSYEKVLKR